MNKSTFYYRLLGICISVIALTGCNLFETTPLDADISPFVPVTRAQAVTPPSTKAQNVTYPSVEPAAFRPAQQNPPASSIWQDVAQNQVTVQSSDRLIYADEFRLVRADLTALDGVLSQSPAEGSAAAQSTQTVLPLPLPDGTFGRFQIEESPIMEPGLAAQFPEIKTYRGIGLDDPTATARLDRTPAGFHGMILSSSGTVYIDPYSRADAVTHMSYYKDDYTNFWGKTRNEEIEEAEAQAKPPGPITPAKSGPTLRTYRLAVAANTQYTNFYGGTVAGALAGIVTTINRVNVVYERDVSIRLNLVTNNNLIIFPNAAPDPYTNNDSMPLTLAQNQTTLDNRIGSANYDIGHVFNTGGGGRAGLGVVCNASNKGRGATGLIAPVGDPFDVDFVAHEIGHQFNARHTWNATGAGACIAGGRDTPYEPAGGTTIMGYAGLCGTQDLQLNSDDNFHAVSIDQMINYVTTGTGNTCGTTISTGNSMPNVKAGPDYTIPRQTPFTLTGSGSDPERDSLTFAWEQFDQAPAGGAWVNPSAPPFLPNTDTDGQPRPIFRSYKPVTTPSRTFPILTSILDGANSNIGESLPNIDRTMQFRLTVRDNRGGVNNDDMTVTVEDAAGPFTVTSPNTAVTWASNSSQNITWDVAGTTAAPVSCANVNILLSIDGGNTFATTLAANTPNDGVETVAIPDRVTTAARVKVECADNIFFDISDSNFNIEETVIIPNPPVNPPTYYCPPRRCPRPFCPPPRRHPYSCYFCRR